MKSFLTRTYKVDRKSLVTKLWFVVRDLGPSEGLRVLSSSLMGVHFQIKRLSEKEEPKMFGNRQEDSKYN